MGTFTITTPGVTVSINGNEAVFHATAHGVGGYIYLDYTQGDESALTVALSYLNKFLGGSSFFSHLTSSAGVLAPTVYTLASTGKYRIPFTFGQNEKKMKMTFNHTGGTPTGTIAVDVTDGGE
jgi:hypothetical protein